RSIKPLPYYPRLSPIFISTALTAIATTWNPRPVRLRALFSLHLCDPVAHSASHDIDDRPDVELAHDGGAIGFDGLDARTMRLSQRRLQVSEPFGCLSGIEGSGPGQVMRGTLFSSDTRSDGSPQTGTYVRFICVSISYSM